VGRLAEVLACAQLGGIPGLANQFSREQLLRYVYEETPTIANDAKTRPQTSFQNNGHRVTLPEFWNVLKGDMSLVGPRPLLMQYLDRYTPAQARRHEVKPGITGWAQVNGRNAITWEEKFALDVWYVDNRSFWLDLKILAMTAWKVLRREGISAEGEATMPEFMGTISTSGKSENA
jgi:sugar transferase EpsL